MVMQLPKKSRFSLPIGMKIFGVATSMLSLLLGVTYLSHQNIRSVNHELIDIAEYLTPLNKNLAEINIHTLEQEIHFERMARYYAMNLDDEAQNEAKIAAEAEAFGQRGQQVAGEIAAALRLADTAAQYSYLEADRLEIARIQAFLEILKTDHQRLDELSRHIMGKLAAGDIENARLLDRQLSDFEDAFDARIQKILFELADFTEAAALRSQAHEESTLRISWILAAIASAVGLSFASLVTVGLLRPVRRLVAQTHAVEQGDLDIEIPVYSDDEIGQLTQSFNAMVQELRDKERLKSTFGQYVDPRIVETLVEQQKQRHTQSSTQSQMMTLFFSDMAGFSSISELLTPTGLVTLINQYLTLASAPIQEHHGVVNQFIGDAVSAFWGPPFVSPEEHAKFACYAALEQFDQLTKLRRALPEIMGIRKGLPEINIRIGLASGTVVAGNIGSDHSKSYTVMGSAVQIAEHLEGASKIYGTQILITATTRELAGDVIETRRIDRMVLAEGSQPEPIYELLGIVGSTDETVLVMRDRFHLALAAYQNRQWSKAKAGFQACLKLVPHDGPTQYYLKQLEQLQVSPSIDAVAIAASS